MLEYIVVAVAVLFAAAAVARMIYKAVTGKAGSGCGGCCGCTDRDAGDSGTSSGPEAG